MRVLTASLLLSASLMTACSAPAGDGTVLSYENAFVQEPIAGRDVTMGGIDITATGGDVVLVSVASDSADSVETHTMEMTDGKMVMRPVERMEIKSGETLSLKRGGNHLMLFGTDAGLAVGDKVDLHFKFEKADGKPLTLDVDADVRPVGE